MPATPDEVKARMRIFVQRSRDSETCSHAQGNETTLQTVSAYVKKRETRKTGCN